MKMPGKPIKIIVASDHVALTLKTPVIDYLRNRNIEVVDLGPFSEDVTVDYPDYAHLLGNAVLSGAGDCGILICGTGLGMSIAANKIQGIRAALCHDPYTAHQARAHNDANVLCMGAWIVSPQRVGGILDEWLNTPFEQGRHLPRLLKLERPAHAPGIRLNREDIRLGVSLSPNPSIFGPLLFAGQLEVGLAKASEYGFDVVELSLRDPSDLSADDLRQMLTKRRLGLSAIATGQSCLHDGMCLASADESGVQGAVERLSTYIDVASELGAAVIVGGIRGKYSGSDTDWAMQHQRAVSAFCVCAEKAAEKKVQLLLEPINRYETNFINTAEEGIYFADKAGHSEVKLLLDTFHMNLEEADIPATLRRFADRIGYIHFADSNRHAPGLGHFPFDQIIATLAEIDYQGVITAEILPKPDDDRAMQQAGAFFKAMSTAETASI